MDRADIEAFFSAVGSVSVTRMFSGHGVYLDDACFAMVLRGGIWLKADDKTRAQFADAGCSPFAYQTRLRTTTVQSFWSLPEAASDDEDELRRWCMVALEAARRTAFGKAAANARRAAKTGETRAPRKHGKTVRSPRA